MGRETRKGWYEMQYVKVKVGGKDGGPGSPVMFDKFGGVISDGGTTDKGEKPSPREQAEVKLHTDANGKPVVPGEMIFSTIMNAGRFHKIGKKQVTTATSSLLPGGLFVVEGAVPIKYSKPWEVDSRAIVTKGGRVIKHRPRFDEWEIEFTLEVDTDIFSLDLVRKLVDDAGKRVGLGSFRPFCKGPFGRFVVVKWEAQKASKKKAA